MIPKVAQKPGLVNEGGSNPNQNHRAGYRQGGASRQPISFWGNSSLVRVYERSRQHDKTILSGVGCPSAHRGVFGYANHSAAGFYGTRGTSLAGVGLYGYNGNTSYYAARAYNSSGSTTPGLRVDGTSYFTGAKTGYVADLCVNVGDETLEQGDVVVVVGFSDAVLGEIPVLQVRKATDPYATGVVGVVDVRQTVEEENTLLLEDPTAMQSSPAGVRIAGDGRVDSVQQGEYLLVVTLGAYKSIKVDASYGAIRPGDLLVSSPNPGYAIKTTPFYILGYPVYPSGTVIGKAVGSLDAGTGVVPVIIILQ